MYYVYILQSPAMKKLYVGYTNDLRKRLLEHNDGKSKFTKFGRPWKLIYYEAYISKKDAMSREKYLKSGWGRNYIKKTLKNYFENKK
jgi:putative endonuclease